MLAILAGHDLAEAATASGLDPDDLADAAQAYHVAGTIALEQRTTARWHQVRASPAGQHSPELTLATVIGPRLDALVASGTATGWWHMNKPPGWRIRLRDTQPDVVGCLFDGLTAAGAITAWSTACYESEAPAFGGTTGMDIAHDLFCADTSGVLDYLRTGNPLLGRRELSVLLINGMLGAAGLDWFERGDVFARVSDMRPQPAPATGQTAQLAAELRVLLTLEANATSLLLSGTTGQWRSAFTDAGRGFADAASSGAMTRGLRAVLAHAVIFHWNRLALPAATQAILARAATAACLPGD